MIHLHPSDYNKIIDFFRFPLASSHAKEIETSSPGFQYTYKSTRIRKILSIFYTYTVYILLFS